MQSMYPFEWSVKAEPKFAAILFIIFNHLSLAGVNFREQNYGFADSMVRIHAGIFQKRRFI